MQYIAAFHHALPLCYIYGMARAELSAGSRRPRTCNAHRNKKGIDAKRHVRPCHDFVGYTFPEQASAPGGWSNFFFRDQTALCLESMLTKLGKRCEHVVNLYFCFTCNSVSISMQYVEHCNFISTASLPADSSVSTCIPHLLQYTCIRHNFVPP